MAKKKSASDDAEVKSTNIKELIEASTIDASFLIDEERTIIPITPAIDVHIKGVPEGSLVILSGKSGTGKSTTALTIAANAQQEEYGSRHVFYSDVEHRLGKSNLEGIQGLVLDKITVITSTEDNILSAENHLNIVLELAKTHKRAVFIIDSISSLCGANEMAEDVKSDFRNSTPKLLANFTRKIAPILRLNKHILIMCSHMIADTSGKGLGFQEDGGEKVKFLANIRMRIKYTDRLNVGSGEDAKQIGQILHWSIIKSPCGVIDKVDSYLRFGIGLDKITESITMACDIGLISKGGAWYTLKWLEKPDEDPIKICGIEKTYNYFVENPEIFKQLTKKIREAL